MYLKVRSYISFYSSFFANFTRNLRYLAIIFEASIKYLEIKQHLSQKQFNLKALRAFNHSINHLNHIKNEKLR